MMNFILLLLLVVGSMSNVVQAQDSTTKTNNIIKPFNAQVTSDIGVNVLLNNAEELGLSFEDVQAIQVADVVPGARRAMLGTSQDQDDGQHSMSDDSSSPKEHSTTYLKQQHLGITLKNRLATVVLENDTPMRVSSDLIPNFHTYVKDISITPTLSAQDAIQKALEASAIIEQLIAAKTTTEKGGNKENSGVPDLSVENTIVPSVNDLKVWHQPDANDPTQKIAFGAMDGISHRNITAQLVWYKEESSNPTGSSMLVSYHPMPSSSNAESNTSEDSNFVKDHGIHLSWTFDLYLTTSKSNWFVFDIDAHTGKVLQIYNYFRGYTYNGVLKEPRDAPCKYCTDWDAPNAPYIDPYLVDPLDQSIDPEWAEASPNGWIYHENVNPQTAGNNVRAYLDLYNDNSGYSGIPQSLAKDYRNLPLDVTANPYDPFHRAAATANLFYWNNHIHDVLYAYGFDEPSGNFQESQLQGEGGSGNDSVFAEVQDGGGMNNANFATPIDGQNPIMQMYLFNQHPQMGPPLDSSFDNAVIVHEYCHGLTFRLTGGPNTNCLFNTEQAGEGWSDFCSLFFLDDDGKTHTKAVGAYLTGTVGGIRPSPYTPNWNLNDYTYGQIQGLSNPHGIGFFFATILWEFYLAMIKEYGHSPDLFDPNAGGNTMAFQIFVQSLKLQPCSPNFVDSRDAMLLADQQIYEGQHECLLWGLFARRGLGVDAAPGNVEDFDVPSHCEDMRCDHFWNGPKTGDVGYPQEYSYEKVLGCAGDEPLAPDQFDWIDSLGWDCSKYALYSPWACEYYGDSDPNWGKVANDMCCVCGGGDTDPTTGICTDTQLISTNLPWQDRYRRACVNFEAYGFCSSFSSNFNMTSYDACCYCGGGTKVIDADGTEICYDITLDLSNSPFMDANGDTCEWYAGDGTTNSTDIDIPTQRCLDYGYLNANFFGRTASDACCVCGGGDILIEQVTLEACPIPETDPPMEYPSSAPSTSVQPTHRPSVLPSNVPSISSVPSLIPTESPTSSPTTVDERLDWTVTYFSDFETEPERENEWSWSSTSASWYYGDYYAGEDSGSYSMRLSTSSTSTRPSYMESFIKAKTCDVMTFKFNFHTGPLLGGEYLQLTLFEGYFTYKYHTIATWEVPIGTSSNSTTTQPNAIPIYANKKYSTNDDVPLVNFTLPEYNFSNEGSKMKLEFYSTNNKDGAIFIDDVQWWCVCKSGQTCYAYI